jgi:hypothetical protein
MAKVKPAGGRRRKPRAPRAHNPARKALRKVVTS